MMVAMSEFNKSPAAFMMFLFHIFVFLSKMNCSRFSGGVLNEWMFVLPPDVLKMLIGIQWPHLELYIEYIQYI